MLTRAGLGFLLLQGMHSAIAMAVCACAGGTGSLEERLDTYDEIFIGKPSGGCGCGTRTTTFEVLESFKGTPVGEEVDVTHPIDEGACGVRFYASDDYLVYVLDGETDACDPGGSTTENSREVEDLRELTQ